MLFLLDTYNQHWQFTIPPPPLPETTLTLCLSYFQLVASHITQCNITLRYVNRMLIFPWEFHHNRPRPRDQRCHHLRPHLGLKSIQPHLLPGLRDGGTLRILGDLVWQRGGDDNTFSQAVYRAEVTEDAEPGFRRNLQGSEWRTKPTKSEPVKVIQTDVVMMMIWVKCL